MGDKEMQEAGVNEKNSQEEYETMMRDSASKRAADSKSITDMSAEKAATEESLQAETDTKADTTGEHMNTMKNIASLHAECALRLCRPWCQSRPAGIQLRSVLLIPSPSRTCLPRRP